MQKLMQSHRGHSHFSMPEIYPVARAPASSVWVKVWKDDGRGCAREKNPGKLTEGCAAAEVSSTAADLLNLQGLLQGAKASSSLQRRGNLAGNHEDETRTGIGIGMGTRGVGRKGLPRIWRQAQQRCPIAVKVCELIPILQAALPPSIPPQSPDLGSDHRDDY